MITGISNTTINNKVDSLLLKPAFQSLRELVLPSKNSLICVEVLNRDGNIYRLLINGRVFSSQLPNDLTKGEKFLAKVISQKPFTLSVSLSYNIKTLSPAVINQIIEKLKLDISPNTAKIVKSLLANNRNLIKSEIESIDRKISSGGHELTEEQISDLVKILNSDGLKKENVNEKISQNFIESFDQLFRSLYESYLELVEIESSGIMATELGNLLIIDNNTLTNFQAFVIRAMNSTEYVRLIQLLENPAYKGLKKLKEVLGKILIQRYFYLRSGVFKNFFVMKKEDGYTLIQYSYESVGKDDLKFSLEISQNGNNPEKFEGIINSDRLLGEIKTENQPAASIEKMLLKLRNLLKDKMQLDAYFRRATGKSGIYNYESFNIEY